LLATGAVNPGISSWAVVAEGAAVIPSILLLSVSASRLVLGLIQIVGTTLIHIIGTTLILIEPCAILLIEGGLAGSSKLIALC
jgi:hypothetical protein